MQTLDYVSGLHNCLEFFQPSSCLDALLLNSKTKPKEVTKNADTRTFIELVKLSNEIYDCLGVGSLKW